MEKVVVGRGRGGERKSGKKTISTWTAAEKQYCREVTCSVLKMSFVFCQLEFLVSTITLNPFSRTSSLDEKREKERKEDEALNHL